MRRAKRPASVSTARTGWARTHSANCWCTAHARRDRRSSTSARANGHVSQSAVLAQAADEERRLEREFLQQDRRHRAHREDPRRNVAHDGNRLRHLSRARYAGRVGQQNPRAARNGFSKIAIDDHTRTFNTQLTSALELGFMLDVAETIVHSALNREESRGAHQRRDFPKRDDDKYLAHSMAWRSAEGPPRIDYRPVVITRWPPGERVYGR